MRNQIGGNVTYEDCIDEDPDNCETKIADLDLESTIGIAMDTAAAHSFQWVCVDLDSDTYDVYAKFSLKAEVQQLCIDMEGDNNCADIDDPAQARVILQKRMMTAQQVRAVKDSLDLS